MQEKKIRVLVVDDSAVIRHLLTEILNSAGDIEVVGTAQDPLFATSKIASLRPDVMTLDVEMPRMDGISFLRKLMSTDPIPVVMVSALTQKGCEATLNALESGAVDYVAKPSIDVSSGVVDLSNEIISKVRIAARSQVKGRLKRNAGPAGMEPLALDTRKISTTDKIIAIGASTGGTQAITDIITLLPESTPGIVIVQHMPPLFTRAFAERLNSLAKMEVKEARPGDRVLRGTVLIAPGGRHMVLKRSGAMYHVDVIDGPMVNFVKPSVNVLFESVALYAGRNAIGVILTGMGEDGAHGLRQMKDAGAFTIAQDEASCVVFGMPKRAIECSAVHRIVPLADIPRIVLEQL